MNSSVLMSSETTSTAMTAPTAWSGVKDSTATQGASLSSATLPMRVVTLGCKVNQYESEFVRELLRENGYRDAVEGEAAQFAVVNTCTVTADSDRKSRHLIRQLARENPGVKIVVMGCYATSQPEVVRTLPGVAAVIQSKRDLVGSLRPFGVVKPLRTIRRFDRHHRAFIKVQDGCILRCSFCIIPKVRPGLLSRPVDDIETEIRAVVEAGFREVVLTGIHLGHYGIDLSQGRPRAQWQRLWHLLDRIMRIPGEFRVRLSSLEATEVTEDFVKVLADYTPRLCPHLHLSLQSGSDRILKAMKRRYRIGRFLDRCDLIKRRLEEPAFTTDVIIGFPGETEDDFQQTMDAVTEVGFTKLHLFPFSARQGTEAASFADRCPPELVSSRRERLAEVEAECRNSYHARLLGRQLEMLVESPDPDIPSLMRGTACRYVPMRLETIPQLEGQLVPVIGRRLEGGVMHVEPATI